MMTIRRKSRAAAEFTGVLCLLLAATVHARDGDDAMKSVDRISTLPPVTGSMSGCGMGMMPMMESGMGHWGMMGGMMGGMGYPEYRLDLSSEQRRRMRAIQRDIRSKMGSLRDRMTEHNDDLYVLYRAERPDPGKIGDVYKKLFDLRRQMIELDVKTRNRMRDLLTEEQKQQLEQITSGRMEGYGYGAPGRPGMGIMLHLIPRRPVFE